MENSEERYPVLNNKKILLHPGELADFNPGLYMNSDIAILYDSSGKNSVMVAETDGIGLAGPLSIQTTPEQWRVAGLWKVNPLIMSSLPSTLYTPVPWMRQSFPKPPQALIDGIVSISSLLAG